MTEPQRSYLVNTNRILLIVALVLALIAAALGFGWLHTDGDPHVLGWLSLAFAFYVGATLA